MGRLVRMSRLLNRPDLRSPGRYREINHRGAVTIIPEAYRHRAACRKRDGAIKPNDTFPCAIASFVDIWGRSYGRAAQDHVIKSRKRRAVILAERLEGHSLPTRTASVIRHRSRPSAGWGAGAD